MRMKNTPVFPNQHKRLQLFKKYLLCCEETNKIIQEIEKICCATGILSQIFIYPL